MSKTDSTKWNLAQQKEEQHFVCFAYGSNMLIKKLRSRCPSAVKIGVCKIKKHVLKFHKVSKKDHSGKCDCEFTESETAEVYGVLFRIPKSEETKLDEIEGLGKGYEKKPIPVTTIEEGKDTAVMYYATDEAKDPNKKPYVWYLNQVIEGAKENCLPDDYIAKIRKVVADEDWDRDRHATEAALYNGI